MSLTNNLVALASRRPVYFQATRRRDASAPGKNAPAHWFVCQRTPVWQPVQTNTLTSGSPYFSDPQWTNYPGCFYRLRSP